MIEKLAELVDIQELTDTTILQVKTHHIAWIHHNLRIDKSIVLRKCDWFVYFQFQLSTLGVSPFFVENISEMQLNSMKLVTTVSDWSEMCVLLIQKITFMNESLWNFFLLQIFSKYEKHRQLILEDIFASLARLPSSKRNLRNYRYVLQNYNRNI